MMPQRQPAPEAAATQPAPRVPATTLPASADEPTPQAFTAPAQPLTDDPGQVPSDPAPVVAGKDQYVIVSGDTLSEIAERYGIEGGWPALYELNRDVIEDPDLIFPGEIITLRVS